MADHGIDLDAVRAKLKGHSIFAPSASAMWLFCSGALLPNLLAPDDAGIDAAYGTVAHGVGEVWLKSQMRPDYLIGTVEEVDEGHEVFNIEIDAVMLNYVEQYVNWCNWLPGDHYTEQRVDFSRLTPIDGQGGTADHIACEPGILTITDLKMGKGVQVFAKDNTQGLLYALGAYFQWDHKYNFKRIIIRIAQPRLGHFDEWEISVADLLEFADYVIERALLAWQPDAVRTPGIKQCQWCKIRANCATRAHWIFTIVDGLFDDLADTMDLADYITFLDSEDFDMSVIPARDLTLAQKVKLLEYRKVIENWLKDIEDDVERRAQSGTKIPGRKMVEGRANRVFHQRNPQKLAETLEMSSGIPAEKFLKTTVLNLTGIEEVIQREGGYRGKDMPVVLEGLVYKPKGKPVLVLENDPRPAISLGDDDAFDDLGGSDDENPFDSDFDDLSGEL